MDKKSNKERFIEVAVRLFIDGHFKDYPSELIAERIYNEIVAELIDEERDKYERLFYTDTSVQH